jgi:hypothetical protein
MGMDLKDVTKSKEQKDSELAASSALAQIGMSQAGRGRKKYYRWRGGELALCSGRR